jgi:hypothetical protein
MPARPSAIPLEPEVRAAAGKQLFNYTWTLLEKPDRDERDDNRMIDAAHASRLFWDEFAEPRHRARSEWQLARVYATVGRPEPALHHARRCLDICRVNGIAGFDLAYAYEALARAHAVAGDESVAADYVRQAREAADHIAQATDRDLVLGDLAELPG